MKRKINSIPVIMAILILVFSGCNHGKSETAEPSMEPGINLPAEITVTGEQFLSSGMKLGVPVSMVFTKTISANGHIVPSSRGWARISPLIPGRVKSINALAGDRVKKGEVLFTMEGNEIIQLQQEYAEAFSHLSSLAGNYERQKSLSEENVTSQKEFISAESEYNAMMARTSGLRARLKMIGVNTSEVERGKISPVINVYSPINGYVTVMKLVQGEFIEPNEMGLELVDTDQLQLTIHVFERDLSKIRQGQKVQFFDPDEPSTMYEAAISRTGKSIDSESKTIDVIARIENGSREQLVKGQFVESTIITATREVLALPAEAISMEEGTSYVLVKVSEKDGSMVFRKVPVKTGQVSMDFVEILAEGLEDVLVEGGYDLVVGE